MFIKPISYVIPQLIYNELNGFTSKIRLLFNQFYIWAVEYLTHYDYASPYNALSFRMFINLAPGDLFKIFTHGISEM